jgi:hypothetical protein
VVNVRTNGGPGASSDFADVFQGIVIEVDELLCAEVESRLTTASAPGFANAWYIRSGQ